MRLFRIILCVARFDNPLPLFSGFYALAVARFPLDRRCQRTRWLNGPCRGPQRSEAERVPILRALTRRGKPQPQNEQPDHSHEQQVPARKAHPAEGVCREGRDQHRDDDRGDRDEEAVNEGVADSLLAEDGGVVVQAEVVGR